MTRERIAATLIGITLSVALFFGVAIAEDDSTHYSFKTIDIPLVGASATTALGINSEGFIVGRYMVGLAVHGYLLTDKGLTIIDDPDILPATPVTYANGVNPKGEVVGYYSVLYLKDGEKDFEFMSRADVEDHMRRYVRNVGPDSPWKTAFDAMAMKTVVRRLARKRKHSA